ncbi:GIY-YIG nuclease family protein [Roseivirga spongicola]|uniref:GIY-YIG nuclease family protein n=1 Tax=Roseivirga spongicola TaxID=333140 RepID=UPI002AC8FBA2|nr:GIY-YIG nuclease family protein [Roseivirga spongicola]WPZ09757.1 GIY-YIG nuclease family protein [Roseivirga spongicola]
MNVTRWNNFKSYLHGMHYTYVLHSEKDNKRYIGYTNDLKLRLNQHHEGKVQSTKDRRPLTLIYYEACLEEWDARKREKYFKTHYGRMYLNKRLKTFYDNNS